VSARALVCLGRVGEVSDLYYALLDAWNRHDATAYAALFTNDGYVVGFDGSEMNGRKAIQRSLAEIFADHETGRYVGKVRAQRSASKEVAMLKAIAGLAPAGKRDLNPETSTPSRRSSRGATTRRGASCNSRTRRLNSTGGRKSPQHSRTNFAHSSELARRYRWESDFSATRAQSASRA
jgi:uncharacterized protein (TIGR02246 family)